ncbi:hypothetical protein, partial [Rhodococcus sp. NPDC057529]|uniref:hypothetical protein n=1 Tax=Rhodococcus sp. NPDC057529 TaxID=3346158 RepID=UPI00367362AA
YQTLTPHRRKKEKGQQIPTPQHQPNPKRRLNIRDAEYQKHLALTFIDTLLSSQRTRAHHHFWLTRQPLRGNFSSLSHWADRRKPAPAEDIPGLKHNHTRW